MGDDDKVVITIKDIYAEMRELVVEVRRLTQHYDNGKTIDDDHEKRIRSLEAWKYGLPAAL
jgi:hypothetical protein